MFVEILTASNTKQIFDRSLQFKVIELSDTYKYNYRFRSVRDRVDKKSTSNNMLEDVHYERDESIEPAVSPERIEELKKKIGLMPPVLSTLLISNRANLMSSRW